MSESVRYSFTPVIVTTSVADSSPSREQEEVVITEYTVTCSIMILVKNARDRMFFFIIS